MVNLPLIDDYLREDGLWAQRCTETDFAGRPALFLDRDGAVVEEVNYLHRAQDVRVIPGTAETIKRANAVDVAVVLVTNQAGIGRNYYGWRHFAEVQGRILSELQGAGAIVDAVFACPHHEEARPPYRHANHPARKPNPGMLLMAAEMLGISLGDSWIVGDRATDIRAGRNAGCAGGIHVRTGHGGRIGEQDASLALASAAFEVISVDAIDLVPQVLPFLQP